MAEENQDPIGDGTEEPSEEAVQEPEALDEAEPEEPKEKKKKKLECPACEAGAPAWMATFADMATLLMAFFVLILSFTEMEDPSITKMLEGTMTEAFGVQRNKPSLEAPHRRNDHRSAVQNDEISCRCGRQGRHHHRRTGRERA